MKRTTSRRLCINIVNGQKIMVKQEGYQKKETGTADMPTLNWIGKKKVVNHHLEVPFYTL